VEVDFGRRLKNSLKFKITVDGKTHDIDVNQRNERSNSSVVALSIDGKLFSVSIVERDESTGTIRVKVNDKEFRIGIGEKTIPSGKPISVKINETPFEVKVDTPLAAIGSASIETGSVRKGASVQPEASKTATKTISVGGKVIRPPMPGKIIAVKVKEGDTVKSGDVVLILEAMKMANEITSPYIGKVREVRVSNGQSVAPEDILIEIE
jgi:biotin carboxyl carrier protein